MFKKCLSKIFKKEENKNVEKREAVETDREKFEKYLNLRNNVLAYTNEDMNLTLTEDNQVYIAVFDIPAESNVAGYTTKTLALIHGLNTHIYYNTGDYTVELEKKANVMQAMQSLLLSISQVLDTTELVENTDFHESNNIRMYLKTRKGTHYKEINPNSDDKKDKFVLMLLNNIFKEIA